MFFSDAATGDFVAGNRKRAKDTENEHITQKGRAYDPHLSRNTRRRVFAALYAEAGSRTGGKALLFQSVRKRSGWEGV